MNLLRDKLTSAARVYEDTLSKNKTELHRLRKELKKRDNKYKIQLDLLKNTLKENTQVLEDCQIELRKSKNESRDFDKNRALLKIKLDDAEREILRLNIRYPKIKFYFCFSLIHEKFKLKKIKLKIYV